MCWKKAHFSWWWQPSKYYTDFVGTADYAGTADYVGTCEWVQLDLQSIQHRDYFGHLSIYNYKKYEFHEIIGAQCSSKSFVNNFDDLWSVLSLLLCLVLRYL